MRRIIYDVPLWSLYLHRAARGLPRADPSDTIERELEDELFERLYAGEAEPIPEAQRFPPAGHSASTTRSRSCRRLIGSRRTAAAEPTRTEALIGALHEVLSGPEVQEAFARAFARRVGERTKAEKPADLERQLAAAQRRVANATRLLVDDPDDLDLRRQREMDRAEVRRREVELAERGTTPLTLPDIESIQGTMSGFLDSLSEASERGREALARCMSPLTLTPKTNGPGRFEASGTIDLAKVVASGSSGGRI